MTGPSPVDRGKPGKLHADEAYEQAELRAWFRGRGIGNSPSRRT
jgi:hypothetical protein